VEVGAAMDGVISKILVKEGQKIEAGAAVAEIACPDLRASLLTAMSTVESMRQIRARLVRGSRDEERLAAEQRTAAAKAVLEQATHHLRRTKELVQAGVMARSVLDEGQRDYDVAEAKLKEAVRQQELVNAPPVAEDLAKADADVRVAENQVGSLEQQISKCTVKAPMSGTVLRILLRAGEAFSTVSPKPLFTMADLSGRRVRAEVDERDVTKVRVGQKVLITSDALDKQRFHGVVAKLATSMGRKKTLTGDPAEKADRDVLEVMVDFQDDGHSLPVGLRVTVQFKEENQS